MLPGISTAENTGHFTVAEYSISITEYTEHLRVPEASRTEYIGHQSTSNILPVEDTAYFKVPGASNARHIE